VIALQVAPATASGNSITPASWSAWHAPGPPISSAMQRTRQLLIGKM
jgi:hypothetical protein